MEAMACYVPLVGDAVEVKKQAVGEAEEWTYAVVEEFKSGLGWCVYDPQTKRKRLVDASAMRPATRTIGDDQPTRRKSVVSGPLTWWQEASLVVETAKSARSRCGGCGAKIAEARLRVGMKARTSRGRYFERREWFHMACFELERRCANASRVEAFAGHLDLNDSDKDKLARFVANNKSNNKKKTTTNTTIALVKKKNGGEGDDGARNELQEQFARACRVVVAQFVNEFKQRAFAAGQQAEVTEVEEQSTIERVTETKVVVCPVTLREMTWADCHVHHAEPAFDQIVRSFARERQLPLVAIRYHLGSFVDQRLAHDFHEYHAAHCRLQAVHKDANLGLLKRKRPPEPNLKKNESDKKHEGEGEGDHHTKNESEEARRKRRKKEKDAMYEEIMAEVGDDEGWAEVDKQALWTAKLGDMWAERKRKRNLKCGRAKGVVGGVLMRILKKRRKTKAEESAASQVCADCGNERARLVHLPAANQRVCYECRTKTYASKQWAKKIYSLSERDLLGLMPEAVTNPISPNFVEMKLYAHSDLLTVARAKHGPGFEPSVPAPM